MTLNSENRLDVRFEDDHLLVVNKPPGVLSQPGKHVDGSIATQAREAYPNATGPMLVHRLDMDTSGLLLLAKSRQAHKALQQQFEQRSIGKRYVAIVSRSLAAIGGCIALPLRLDINNRPVQIMCRQHGKSALTLWQLSPRDSRQRATETTTPSIIAASTPIITSPTTRVVFTPITGRTHQLRVHAAHKHGLNAAIVGDRLYGQAGGRLMLHAQQLVFMHPETGQRVSVDAPVPF